MDIGNQRDGTVGKALALRTAEPSQSRAPHRASQVSPEVIPEQTKNGHGRLGEGINLSASPGQSTLPGM